MSAEDYEPDDEDFACMIAQEREVKSMRSEYHDADRQLRDYQKHTDRQLRALSKGKKGCARTLAWLHQFDVVSDTFEVEIADDVWDTVPWPYDDQDVSGDALPEPTRKDKRRVRKEQRKEQRKAAHYLERIRLQQGRNPVKESVVRKTGVLVPAVAA